MPVTANALRTVLACCAAAAVTACAGNSPASSTSSPPSVSVQPSPAATTTAAGDPQALARQAYLGMWHAYVIAARTADYQAPPLEHYAAGAGLSVLTHALYQEHQDGDVTLGQPVLDPKATVAKGSGGDVTQAEVTDCADSSHWLNYHDGKLIVGQDARRRHIIARLQPFDGTWKVTYLNVGRAGTC